MSLNYLILGYALGSVTGGYVVWALMARKKSRERSWSD